MFLIHADSKFTSFQRQLNLYQFKRRKGAHAGAFHHPSFRRGQRHLLSKVRRQKVKRDLAVEARAAQRLARARETHHPHRSSEHVARGSRTRAAAQADLRTVKHVDDGGMLSEEDYAGGSRRSALRRRVDSGQSSGYGNEDESSTEENWSVEAVSQIGRFPGNDAPRAGEWGDDWRSHVPGSPARSPRQLRHVSTPMTSSSSTEYEYSPRDDYSPGGSSLDRTYSVGSSLSSSLSASPSHHNNNNNVFYHSPHHFHDDTSDSSQDSPMSVHSPVAAAVAAVQAAQASSLEHGLSLAAVVDASVGGGAGNAGSAGSGWQSPPNGSSSERQFEPFGWAPAINESAAPWPEQPSPAAGASQVAPQHQHQQHHHQHHQQQSQHQSSSHQEEFGFMDLFASFNWDSSNDDASGGGAPIDAATENDSRTEAFMKEAEAAGVFGVEEYLMPRSNYGGPGAFA